MNCPISINLKPASEHSLDNFWSSDNFQIVPRILASGFPVTLPWLASLREEVVQEFLVVQLTWCLGFHPELSDQLAIMQSNPLLLRKD